MSDIETLQQIARDTSYTKERLAALDVHIKNIIGPPSLEERLRIYIDGRDDHGKRNMQESLQLMQKVMEQTQQISKLELEKQILDTKNIALSNHAQLESTEKTRAVDHASNEAQHKATGKKVDWLVMRVSIGIGLIMAAQAYLAYAVHTK